MPLMIWYALGFVLAIEIGSPMADLGSLLSEGPATNAAIVSSRPLHVDFNSGRNKRSCSNLWVDWVSTWFPLVSDHFNDSRPRKSEIFFLMVEDFSQTDKYFFLMKISMLLRFQSRAMRRIGWNK